MNAERRRSLRRVGLVVGAGALGAPFAVSAVRPAPLASERFASIDAAIATLTRLGAGSGAAPKLPGAWDLPQVLHHAAQSIDYSLYGFPVLKAAWFRATVGAYAFALFDASGRMTHDLGEPIPGAPAIAASTSTSPEHALASAAGGVVAALRNFAAHTGALAPHFAYGRLDKPAYTRAHLMHLADHLDAIPLA